VNYALKKNDCVVLPGGETFRAWAEKNLEMLRVSLPAEKF
jgi:hypothetical protein